MGQEKTITWIFEGEQVAQIGSYQRPPSNGGGFEYHYDVKSSPEPRILSGIREKHEEGLTRVKWLLENVLGLVEGINARSNTDAEEVRLCIRIPDWKMNPQVAEDLKNHRDVG